MLLVALVAVVAAILLGYILYQRSHTRDIDRADPQAQQEIRVLDDEKAQAQAILNQPPNRDIADQSEFLNELVRAQGAVVDAYVHRDGTD